MHRLGSRGAGRGRGRWCWWLLRAAPPRRRRAQRGPRTATGSTPWSPGRPTATRILTTAERQAYGTLERALPGYMILAQVPLARFLKVPTRHSYAEWLRRAGHAVRRPGGVRHGLGGDRGGQRAAAGRLGERARPQAPEPHGARAEGRRHPDARLDATTRCRRSEAAREMLHAQGAGGAPPAPAAPSPVADTRVRPSRPTPFDDTDRDSAQDERIECASRRRRPGSTSSTPARRRCRGSSDKRER